MLARSISIASTLKGEFLLRSGQTSTEYFDKYRFESDPAILRPLAILMAELVDPNSDLLGGLELGGVPLATSISLHTGTPAVFVRKEAKKYGTCKAIEGPEVAGKRIAVIEDVVTTGGQIVESVGLLRAAGATVDHIVCAIWRGKDLSPLKNAGLDLRWVFSADEIREASKPEYF